MNLKRMNLLIAGGTGLLGRHIISLLDEKEYEIRVLSRSKRSEAGIKYYQWDLEKGSIDLEAFKNLDAIINLAGAGIADKRWTKTRKKEIIDSRVDSNMVLLKAIQETGIKPIFISASAIGIYGDRKDEELTESSSLGTKGFLAETTTLWENSSQNLHEHVARLAIIRVGLVLSTKGGALQKMIEPARFGSVAYFGKGDQYYAWIHIDDIARIFIEAINNDSIQGIYNGVSTDPIPVKKISQAIKSVLGGLRIVHPVPKPVLDLILGEMSSMLFNSARVLPTRLKEAKFEFKFTEIQSAIKDLLERKI